MFLFLTPSLCEIHDSIARPEGFSRPSYSKFEITRWQFNERVFVSHCLFPSTAC